MGRDLGAALASAPSPRVASPLWACEYRTRPVAPCQLGRVVNLLDTGGTPSGELP